MTRHRLVAAVVALFLVVAQVATVAAAPGQGNTGERTGDGGPDRQGAPARPESGHRDGDRRRVRRPGEPECRQEGQGSDKRGDAVVKSLKTTAATSQKTARATVAKTKGATATSYWLVNVLVVEGDAKTLDKVAKQLAKQPGVTQHPRPADLPPREAGADQRRDPRGRR